MNKGSSQPASPRIKVSVRKVLNRSRRNHSEMMENEGLTLNIIQKEAKTADNSIIYESDEEKEDVMIPIPDDSPFSSKNVSPERQARTLDSTNRRVKVEKIKVRKSPTKKESCKEVVGPRLDYITR